MEKGTRVGAISHSSEDNKTVYFFGYGTYEGDEVPEGAVGMFAAIAIESGLKNPKIKLDNGEIVWGCECWFGPEAKVKEKLALYDKVVPVSIGDTRQRWMEENGV